MIRHFKDNAINAAIEEKGFAVVPFARQDEIKEISQFYHSLPGVDAKGTYVTMFHPSYEYRKQVDDKLKELFEPKAAGLLKDYHALFANFMVKERGMEGDFPVHQDWTYVDESKFSSYAFWVPLQDVNTENGALHVVPGSHKYLTALRGPNVFEPFAHLTEAIKSKYSEPIALKAGEALIWDHRLIHFSRPNLGPQPRLAFTLIMVPNESEVFHFWGSGDRGTSVSKYAVDSQFYLNHTIGKQPEGVPLIETLEQKPIPISEEIFSNHSATYKEQSQKTAAYYDQWQKRYNEVYGDTIQAFRPADKEALMKYITSSADIKKGETVLDAGCGVGGPSIWLARNCDVNVSGITISEAQAQEAKDNIQKAGLSDKIKVEQGDYHELTRHFGTNSFDKVLFLESLGHAGDPGMVIEQAFRVLKPGTSIYIKDFYVKEPADEYWKGRIQKVIANINRLYSYNTLKLNDTLSALRAVGFEIDFIRRFSFQDDISIRYEFESRFGIDIFGGEPEFYPAEWLEIKCLKPAV